ncbi:MAG: hypothetical protein JNK02_01810 [Planctomycetes bacterium]|nr:hypothetical protein [Planctomycetota bacterium]
MKTTMCIPERALRRGGFGLVEVAISGTILLVLAASMVEAVRQVGALGRSEGTISRLQDEAQDALASIAADLKDAGFVDTNGRAYPFLFEDGAAGGDFAVHDHAPAAEHAAEGEPGFGPNREIVFVKPAFREVVQDADGVNHELVDEDGNAVALPAGIEIVKRYAFPVIGNDGRVAYDAAELSFVVVTAADGVNELQRRRDGGAPSVVARGVERVVFDTSATDPLGVPVGAVRARLWMRMVDQGGTAHSRFVETVVRLKNGG